MAKNRHALILIFLMLISFPAGKAAIAADPLKDIEIIEPAINFTSSESQYAAYLCMELKNTGTKNIANADIEVRYYDPEGHLVKKAVLKNKLTEIIPPGEKQKYRIRLKRDVFNERYEEYPYSHRGEVNEFDVKILNIKFK